MGRNYFFPRKPHRPIPPSTIVSHALINAITAIAVLYALTLLVRLI